MVSILVFSFTVHAQEQDRELFDSIASYELFGDITSYYKNQTDYATPLDALWEIRSGATNRSKQNTELRVP